MNDHAVSLHSEGYAGYPPKADNPEIWPKIVATRSALRKKIEPETILDDRAYELVRAHRAWIQGNRAIKFIEMSLGPQ